MKKIVLILLFCSFLLPALSYGQCCPGACCPDNDPPPSPGGDPGVPIDGGVVVLLAAGAAYGVKRYRSYKSKTESNHGQSF